MDWHEVLIKPNTTIVETIKIIDASALQIALVVDENERLIGTVTDGDIRRGILKGIDLNKPVTEVMKNKFIFARPSMGHEEILKIMKEKYVNQLPIVDGKGRVVRLELLSDLIKEQFFDNLVVLMAGGLGTRLRPLTDDCPKPMVKVGGKPVLETILENFIEQGFRRFYFSVNHLKEKISDYFRDGKKWGVEINYLVEDKKMGTAGALSLIPGNPDRPLIVMNGDLLTKVNYAQLLDFHRENKADATMCLREYSFQIPYGVVKIEKNMITEIDEKPTHSFFVNAGVYILEPEVLKLIPKNTMYDMTTVFEKLIENQKRAAVFPIREYWIDVGYYEDYKRADSEYRKAFTND